MTYRALTIAAILLLIGAGCAGTAAPANQNANGLDTSAPSGTTSDTSDHGDTEHLAVAAGSRIALDGKNNLKPESVDLSFKLYGLDGHAFGPNDLTLAHEKKMHLLLVRDDMQGFQHVHPDYKKEKWTVSVNVPEAGHYQMYVDIDPEEEEPTVLRVPLTIGGPTAKKNPPVPNAAMSADDGAYRVALDVAGALKSGDETRLTFVVTENGKPAANIDPYLGAYGHVVLLRHGDVDDFFHVHPVTETKPADGRVQFDAVFPVTGRYTLYAQFNVKGTVRTFPITVDVHDKGDAGAKDSGVHH